VWAATGRQRLPQQPTQLRDQQCVVLVWVCDEGQQVGHVLAGDLAEIVLWVVVVVVVVSRK
jgi:hypothetical protein